MKTDLEPAKKVLRSFLADIEDIKTLRRLMSIPQLASSFTIQDQTPEFDASEFIPAPNSYWEQEDAYIWLYADAWDFRSFMQQPKNNQMPEYYLQAALPLYQQWRDQEKEVVYRGCIIPIPDDVSLEAYLRHLSSCIEEKNEKRSVWIKSLKSFTQFIRDDIPLELQGTLESIFPYKMKINRGYSFKKTDNGIQKFNRSYILRNVDDPVFPIDILAASDILKNLTMVVLEGRPNSQHAAAEALGFALICHAVGSARVITRENIIHEIPLTALKFSKPAKNEILFHPQYYANIQSFYGFKDAPISKTLYDYLISLPRNQGSVSIFSKPISTLLRTLYDKGVKRSELARSLGTITFRTFMSQSTHWFGHRPG
ncbi:MAG TPA: hypothetical protein VIH61_03795 [Waddliaceae bacterium]